MDVALTPPLPKSTTPRAFGALDPALQVSARGIEVGHIFYFGTNIPCR